jgi:hypothetical protein
MKTITFRGRLAIGTQDKLRLSTNNGKTGYKITKFEVIPQNPGDATAEAITKIFTTNQTGSIGSTVDFTDSDLIAVSYYQSVPVHNSSAGQAVSKNIIFDNAVINQNVFVTVDDATGNTDEINYYIELEAFAISDLEATKLTLASIKTIKA